MSRQQAIASVLIAAAPEAVAAAAIDVESYPVWTRAVKSVTVAERDDEGRPTVAGFRSSALGRAIRYTLRFDYTGLPASYSWTMVEGDPRAIDGEYTFDPQRDGSTRVAYRLRVDLGLPLPTFVLRQAERLVLSLALKELKTYVES